MSEKSQTLASVLFLIKNAGLYDLISANLSLPQLFVFRYLLDQTNDIVNLQKDIEDLPFFPQRLTASYQDEWIIFCKKSISKMKLKDISEQQREFLLTPQISAKSGSLEDQANSNIEALSLLKDRLMMMQECEIFKQQFEQLCLIDKVLSNSDIAVLKSEQQRKIERFIK